MIQASLENEGNDSSDPRVRRFDSESSRDNSLMRQKSFNRSYQKEMQEEVKDRSLRLSQNAEEIIRESHLKRVRDSETAPVISTIPAVGTKRVFGNSVSPSQQDEFEVVDTVTKRPRKNLNAPENVYGPELVTEKLTDEGS